MKVLIQMDLVEHFEIPADDMNRAINFYRTVFGWENNPIPGVDYKRLLTKRISEKDLNPRPFEVNGAIVERSDLFQRPIITISVKDMDATLKKIHEYGGTIKEGKKPLGERGYTAYFLDTEGNTMGLWQMRSASQV